MTCAGEGSSDTTCRQGHVIRRQLTRRRRRQPHRVGGRHEEVQRLAVDQSLETINHVTHVQCVCCVRVNKDILTNMLMFVIFLQDHDINTRTHARAHARTHAHAHARAHPHTHEYNYIPRIYLCTLNIVVIPTVIIAFKSIWVISITYHAQAR